ncbi:ABC transporter ATP-binding protein [Mycetocola sp.]|uniref:ABC transporter ATP-binding protein n=1 Tax=Mycetocola sp. TaxID=1871042 RepID=UPI003988DA57
MPAATPSLELRGLGVAYGSVRAVRDLSVGVAAGEVLGVIGSNGAGKTSIVNAVIGAVPLASGTLSFEGKDLTSSSIAARVRAGIAVSPEGRGILPGLTVQENLLLGAYSVRRSIKSELSARLDQAFEFFPVLKERRMQMAQTLSGGEAAMLSIGRALMSGPRLLLLDEPTLGLAPIMRARLFERIAVLKETGLAMIIVEQRAAELLDVSDRLLQLQRGEAVGIVEAGDVDVEALAQLYFGGGATPGSEKKTEPKGL